MEIDRIQPVKGLKVERTGSEQERRKRPQTEEDFSEILESSMSEEDAKDDTSDQDRQERSPRRDTVSLATGTPTPPVVSDLVSISSAAKVGAEMHSASRSVDDSESPAPGPDTFVRESQIVIPPQFVQTNGEDEPESADGEEDDTPVKIDTLA